MHKFTKKQIRDAVANCNGTMVDLGRKLGLTNGNTAERHLNRFPDLVEEFNKRKASLIDISEDTLIYCLKCQTDAVRFNAARFILQTVGKDTWGDDTKEDTQAKLVSLVDKLIDNATSNKDDDNLKT